MTLNKSKNTLLLDCLVSVAVIAVFFLLFALAEFGLRQYTISKEGENNFLLQWRRLTHSVGPFTPDGKEINQLGFHSPEIPVQKAPGTYRILVTGGSAVYGWQEIESSWVWFLEKRLKAEFPDKKIEVINGGMPGATTNEEYSMLKDWIVLKPDLVISYTGWNDIYYSHYCSEEWDERVTEYGVQPRSEEARERVLFFIETSSYLFVKLEKGFYEWRKSWKKKRDSASHDVAPAPTPIRSLPLPKDYATKLAERRVHCKSMQPYTPQISGTVPDIFSIVFENNLKAMLQLTSRNKIPHIVILQPNLAYSISKHQVPEAIVEKLKLNLGSLYEDWSLASTELYPKAENVIRKLKEDGVLAHSFVTILDGEKTKYFTDSVHIKDPDALDYIAEQVQNQIASDVPFLSSKSKKH
jgi:hypothetical protein